MMKLENTSYDRIQEVIYDFSIRYWQTSWTSAKFVVY